MIRLIVPIFIIAVAAFIIYKVTALRGRRNRQHHRVSRRANLEGQLRQAKADLMTYDMRAQGQCPYCNDVVMDSDIKCSACGERFWMTRQEAMRSKEAGKARIDKLNEMLRTIE